MEINGQQIAYRRSPGDGRAVVLVHGNSSSASAWRRLMDGPFGERFRCFAFDLPGHGSSPAFSEPGDHALPGYASILRGFVDTVGAREAVVVGWSLGGHIALEAAPELPDVGGFAIFGTPPISDAGALAEAFLPNPAVNIGFTAEVSPDEATAYAASMLAPESEISPEEFVPDILATDPVARSVLGASIAEGRFRDELAVTSALSQPLAVLHGGAEQLVRLDYLRSLQLPTLWREVQVVDGAGHALQAEAPQRLAALLTEFIDALD